MSCHLLRAALLRGEKSDGRRSNLVPTASSSRGEIWAPGFSSSQLPQRLSCLHQSAPGSSPKQGAPRSSQERLQPGRVKCLSGPAQPSGCRAPRPSPRAAGGSLHLRGAAQGTWIAAHLHAPFSPESWRRPRKEASCFGGKQTLQERKRDCSELGQSSAV